MCFPYSAEKLDSYPKVKKYLEKEYKVANVLGTVNSLLYAYIVCGIFAVATGCLAFLAAKGKLTTVYKIIVVFVLLFTVAMGIATAVIYD